MLHRKPDTLDELKNVLNMVNIIRNEGMEMELSYTDLEERCRTRQLYATTPEEEAQCGGECVYVCYIVRCVRYFTSYARHSAWMLAAAQDSASRKLSSTV